LKLDLSTAFAHRCHQGTGEDCRAAATRLRLAFAGKQGRDVMTEAITSQIDFPQSVEKEQASLNDRMFELFQDEFKRRESADL
jgi:hypothetical protein